MGCSKGQRLQRGMHNFDRDLLEKYPHYPSDCTLAKAMNCSWNRVVHHREILGLPDPRGLSALERQMIVKEKLA